MVDFTALIGGQPPQDETPRAVFMRLTRHPQFQFPRDIQTEVWNAWDAVSDRRDNVIKLNVGSGKMVVGLVILQTALNRGQEPAVFVCPNNQLLEQVIAEAAHLGLSVTRDPRDAAARAGEAILVINIQTLFNGRSKFGVGENRIPIGTIIIDDAHACIAAVQEQFRITIPNTNTAYAEILAIFRDDLYGQSPSRLLSIEDGDPQAAVEVPFWNWQRQHDRVLQILHANREDDDLKWNFPLLQDELAVCRCVITGNKLEIEPQFPPTDIIRAFDDASHRIYMTATLADDSVLVTHFGADANELAAPIVPTSPQIMGERMILMPQDINPDINMEMMKDMLLSLAEEHNVVVIIPGGKDREFWEPYATAMPLGDDVASVVEQLRNGHVGLVVFSNRYDGIDLPGNACRVLAIFGLPEVSSLIDAQNCNALSEAQPMLRRQIERIEQGMGRGVRSNNDYCVVLLGGADLTRRIKSPDGRSLLTPPTRAQMDVATQLAGQLVDADIPEIRAVIDSALARDQGWVNAIRTAAANAQPENDLHLEPLSVAMRQAFDERRNNNNPTAARILQEETNAQTDPKLKAWLDIRRAEAINVDNEEDAQRLVAAARRRNRSLIAPIAGRDYLRLEPATQTQAETLQAYHIGRFIDPTSRILDAKSICDDLIFDKSRTRQFETAFKSLGLMIGAKSQMPESEIGEGPDNMWAWKLPNSYFVIEAKSGTTSNNGISRNDMGQMDQSLRWFASTYIGQASPIAIMIHKHRNMGEHAVPIPNMRVMCEAELNTLKVAFQELCKSLGQDGAINNIETISTLLRTHNFTPDRFVNVYTNLI
ncbi:MAG: DEAD/DEAH box helicase [Methylophaga sp.]|nr:MAG: DEAD/DEAH box helicase [Methylophaga sp.]